MSDFIKTQNSFADGEVSPEFFARDNLNGLACLENMDITPGGGLTRRDGLSSVSTLPSNARLVPFSVDDTHNYLLILMDYSMRIYAPGQESTYLLITPWKLSDLAQVQYAQRFGTMIFVHSDYPPQVLRKTGSGFELVEFAFSRNDTDMSLRMPFMRFDDSDGIKITITTNASGPNTATLTTDADFWTSDCIDGRLQILGKQWTITQYISPRVVYAYVNGGYDLPDEPVSEWYESAFSKRRGWPRSITFHQDRLVFGGTRSWPGGLWLSQVGRHNNFDSGTGLDDEAISITLLSQTRQQICTLVSSDNLQILTNAGEWAISSKPLTPSSVDIKQHTSVGSVSARYLPCQKIEGATVFISATRTDIRELSLDALGENYNARDLCPQAKHLMCDPVDISYNERAHRLYVVMSDGQMATLNQNSSLGISGWARYTTHGKFTSVATIDNETYVVVLRGNEYCLEKFSADTTLDAGEYSFAYTAVALPLRVSGHNARLARVRKVSVRVLNTKTLYINGMRVVFPNEIYGQSSPGYSGDVSVNILGKRRNSITSPWEISSNEQLPTTILSVCTYGYYTV